jgi:hypothetical protein
MRFSPLPASVDALNIAISFLNYLRTTETPTPGKGWRT